MSSTEAIGYAGLAQSRKLLKQQKVSQSNPKHAASLQSRTSASKDAAAAVRHGKHLSDALINSCCNNELRRANLSGKFISKIDTVDPRFRNLESILLGNNELVCLDGIEQFSYLRSLSLVNNLIQEFDNVQALEKLHHLEALHLSGCPITKRPNFVAYMATTIPSLKRLDSVMITKPDREFAQLAILQQKSMISIMIANEATIRILHSLQRKIRIHADLIQTAFGRVRIFNRTDFVPSLLHQLKLNEAVKILAFTQDPHRKAITEEIVKRIEMMWRSSNELSFDETSLQLITRSWDYALSESMAVQQERLASAISLTEIARSEAQSKISLLIKRRRYPHRDVLQPTLQSELKSKKALSSGPERKSVKFRKDPQCPVSKSQEQQGLAESKSPPALEGSAPGAQISHQQERQAIHFISHEGQRIAEVESLNLKLVQKLQQFQDQNRENVLQAEADARMTSEQIQRLSATVKDLQQQAECYKFERDRYQTVIGAGINQDSARSAFLDRIAELERLLAQSRKELAQCQLVMAEDRKRIQDQQEELRKCSIAQQLKSTKPHSPEAKAAGQMKGNVDSRLIGIYLSVESRRVNSQLRAALSTWKSRIASKHAWSRLRAIASQRLIGQIWFRWQLSIDCVRYSRIFQKRRLLQRWRNSLSSKLKRRRNRVLMLNYQQRCSIRSSWVHWRRLSAWRLQSRSNPESRADQFHHNAIVRSMLCQWRLYVSRIARPWKQKNLAAKYFHLIRCISRYWTAWKDAHMTAKTDCSRHDLASIHHQIKLQRRVFLRLRIYSAYLSRKESLRWMSSNYRTKTTLRRWYRIMRRQLHWNQIIAERQFAWDHRRLSCLFNCWLAHWRLRAKEVRVLNQTIELDRIRALKAAYSHWRRIRRLNHGFLVTNSARVAAIKNRYLAVWSDVVSRRLNCRNNQKHFAAKVLAAARLFMMKTGLRRILYFCQSSMHFEFAYKIINQRRRWRLIRCNFHQWITSWLLTALTRLRAVLHDAHSKIECLQTEREGLSADAVRYADTASKLRDTVLEQSLAMTNKDAAFERLQIAHDKLEDRIESMEENEEALLGDIRTLNSKYQTISNEKELLKICIEQLKETLRKTELERDEDFRRQSNIVRTVETVLAESMIALVASNFQSVENVKDWIQQLIRHLQHTLNSARSQQSSQPEASILNLPIIADIPFDHHRSFSQDGETLQ